MSKSMFQWLQSVSMIAIAMMAVTAFVASPVFAQETEQAEEKQEEEKKEEEKVQPEAYEVPENASADELVEFIKSVEALRPTTREGNVAHRRKAPAAIRKAAEMIMEADASPEAISFAEGKLLVFEVGGAFGLNLEKKQDLFNRIKKHLAGVEELDRNHIGMAMSLARSYEYSNEEGAIEKGIEVYTELQKMFADSGSDVAKQAAESMVGTIRKLQLPGNAMELTGTRLDGTEFDIAELKGKVVLVDFWATWCGPCIAEHPNIKKNYEKYHEKGFEVVGVSVDRNREALDKFVEEHQTKWITLNEEGGRSPAAAHYGVTSIPTMILVGRDGKVISIKARGQVLTKLLEKEFGEDDSDSDKPN